MPPRESDRARYRARVVQAIERGLADIDAGRTISDEELRRLIERRYGKPRSSR